MHNAFERDVYDYGPIQSEKTERYKRNLIVVSAAVIALTVEGNGLSGLNFFGVKLSYHGMFWSTLAIIGYNLYFTVSLTGEDWKRFSLVYYNATGNLPLRLLFFTSSSRLKWQRLVLRNEHEIANIVLGDGFIQVGRSEAQEPRKAMLIYHAQMVGKAVARYSLMERALPVGIGSGALAAMISDYYF